LEPRKKTTIVCFGPGPRFKGGIANYNTSLAKALDKEPDTEVHIVSWTQQYPAIIPRDFIDRKSRADQLAGTNIRVHYVTNYNNPFTWQETVRVIRGLQPDKVIIQWAIAIQGLPLGFIAKGLRQVPGIEVIFDLHVVTQKEGSTIDRRFTRRGLRHAHSYIVHAYKTADELQRVFPDRQFDVRPRGAAGTGKGILVRKLFHPVYDMFAPDPAFDVKAQKAAWGLRQHVFLFFGFIRKYKGLHDVIEAYARVARERDDVSLMIVGEAFWNTLDTKKVSTRIKNTVFGLAKRIFLRAQDDERNYNPLARIDELGIRDRVFTHIDFVPNEDVHMYFQVSDAIVLFYLTATPSGIESIAYNFNLPMLATRVGHFGETVTDGVNGYLAEPGDIGSMADVMRKSIERPIDRARVAEASRDMSWRNYALEILR
jgi:glycosyltransferase involved in cell wall biosynthesis